MATYINDSDITDLVLKDFGAELSAKVTLSDAEVEDMAERKGLIDKDEIETNPVHYQVKKYAINWVARELCLDALGKNNVDVSQIEKYDRLYDVYRRRLRETDSAITKQILRGSVSNTRDRGGVNSDILFVG